MATATGDMIPFTPKRRIRVDWWLVLIGIGFLAGIGIMTIGALILAKQLRAPFSFERGLDVIALGFLVAASPPAYRIWANRRRYAEIDERLPDFLTDVASLHKAGLTLQDSILAASEGSYGSLDLLVKQAAAQVRWNLPVMTVLENLQREIGTRLAVRTFAVVIEAGRTGGNVPEVLEIAAENARAAVQMKQARTRAMSMYTIITYVASLVFIGVALAMQTIFVPKMLGAFGTTGGGGIGLARTLPTPQNFRTMFYVAALVQGAGNGIVGGIMSEGSTGAGLRHSCIMVALAAAGFALGS